MGLLPVGLSKPLWMASQCSLKADFGVLEKRNNHWVIALNHTSLTPKPRKSLQLARLQDNDRLQSRRHDEASGKPPT